MNDRSYNQVDLASNVLQGQRDDPADVAFEKSSPGDVEWRIEFPLNELFPMSASEDLNRLFTAAKDHLSNNRLSEALIGFRDYRKAHAGHLRALNLEAITYSRIHGDGPETIDLFLEGLAIAARYLAGTEEPSGFAVTPTAVDIRLQQAQLYINLGACFQDLANEFPSRMLDAMNAFAAGYAIMESSVPDVEDRMTMTRACAYSAIRVADAAIRSGRKVMSDRYLGLALDLDKEFTERFLTDRSYLRQLQSSYNSLANKP